MENSTVSLVEEFDALRLDAVSKTFDGVRALSDVSFSVKCGEVHALLGENGAGKSTLMSIACGDLRADQGRVEIGGVVMESASPGIANQLGIGVVYQNPAIVKDLTVQENMVLAMPPDRRPSAAHASAWAAEKVHALDPGIHVDTLASNLTLAERETVEIAKALALEPRVLILDEPTAVMHDEEVEQLFARIREISARGIAVVYISHRIPEIKQIANRVTILRDGRAEGTFEVAEISDEEILRLVAGREVTEIFPTKSVQFGETVVKATDLVSVGLEGVSFEARSGEILGFGGATGNGQVEATRILAGLQRFSGSIEVNGIAANLRNSSLARSAGIAYIPADRPKEGIFPGLSVAKNSTAQALNLFATAGVQNNRKEHAAVVEKVREFSIRTPTVDTDVGKLSGGSQQKVVIARSIFVPPLVLLCDDPTQGVDVGTRSEIYRTLRALAAQGSTVIVVSSDTLELSGLCDRVLIFSRGQVVRELSSDEVTEAAISNAAMTSTLNRRRHATETDRDKSPSRDSRFLRPKVLTPLLLLAIVVAVGLYTDVVNPSYLGAYNLRSVLYLAATLILVSLGQLTVLLTGGIDLSVGPLMALTVVVLSFFENSSSGAGSQVLGYVLVIAIGIVVGVFHGVLIRWIKLPPVIVTVITFIGFQGLALLLRSTPGGTANPSLVSRLGGSLGYVPIVLLVAALLAIGMEGALTKSRFGLAVRSVGSNEKASHRIGVNVSVTVVAAYIVCALLAVAAGTLLYAQVGIGDPTVGINYSLESITAVVLGGASIYGGRGSFLGAAMGAILLTQAIGALAFLNLNLAWQYWFPGLLIIGAGVLFSGSIRERRVR